MGEFIRPWKRAFVVPCMSGDNFCQSALLLWRVSDVELDGDRGGKVPVAVPRRHGELAGVCPPRAPQRQQGPPLHHALLPGRPRGLQPRREGPRVVDLRRVPRRPQADVLGVALDDGVAAERLRPEVRLV